MNTDYAEAGVGALGMEAVSGRPILSPRPLKLTPDQERAAQRAGMLGLAANLALDMGTITRERHREVLRSLAPAFEPVIAAMEAQVRAARARSD